MREGTRARARAHSHTHTPPPAPAPHPLTTPAPPPPLPGRHGCVCKSQAAACVDVFDPTRIHWKLLEVGSGAAKHIAYAVMPEFALTSDGKKHDPRYMPHPVGCVPRPARTHAPTRTRQHLPHTHALTPSRT